MSSTDVDTKLQSLIASIHAKVPADKKLSVDVVLKLLKAKFVPQFPGINFDDKVDVITRILASLQTPPSHPPAHAVSERSGKVSDSGEDDESDEDSDEEDSDEEDSDEEAAVEEGAEEDEEDDESDFSGDDSDDSDDDAEAPGAGGDEPAAKKPRIDPAATVADLTVDQRVEQMVFCANKLGYRPRKPNEGETTESYLTAYLIPFFESKHMDPTKFSTDDIRRYKVRKELADLQADGGSLTLDRNCRRGRAVVTAAPPPPQSSSMIKPVFLDEEE